MTSAGIILLGGIAGITIFLGLPIGRLRRPAAGPRAFLNAAAAGVLVFLLFDVLVHAVEPVEQALIKAAVDHAGGWGRFAVLATVFTVGLLVGLISLGYYERWMSGRPAVPARRPGPGTMVAGELAAVSDPLPGSAARRLALLIAVGIGLHNFSEGLAIGQSAAAGKVGLAVLLVVGFGLHNATEGFGITGPLAAEGTRPSWAFLGMLGLIGGGPTFLGTLLGQAVVNDVLYLAFLALAAGSILYVVIQLFGVGVRLGRRQALYWGVLFGLFAGLATDFVVVAAGG